MKQNSLWREVTKEEKDQIRKESKSLLTEFASKLEKIKITKTAHHENSNGTRKEGTGWKTDQEFLSTSLSNAPLTEDNFIIAEKGAWKK